MNQAEIDSYDQHCWRRYRQFLYDNIKTIATKKNFDYVHHDQLDNIESSNDVIVTAYIFDLIPDKSWFAQLDLQCQKMGKKVYYFTDNIVGNSYKFDTIKIFSIPKILGITANYSKVDLNRNKTKTKLFNCFMQRSDSVRQSWFYFLYEKNLLDSGYVSFLLKQLTDYSSLTGKELFTWIHDNFELGELPHFQNAYINLVNQVPYQNFVEQNNLIPLVLDSKYSLNLETYANAEQDCWCFTEKSLRSLQLPTIDLMFIQTNGYKILQNLGFQLLDHSDFDHLSWQQRQEKILEILENDSVDCDDTLMIEQAYHNQDILSNWKEEVFAADFFERYFES